VPQRLQGAAAASVGEVGLTAVVVALLEVAVALAVAAACSVEQAVPQDLLGRYSRCRHCPWPQARLRLLRPRQLQLRKLAAHRRRRRNRPRPRAQRRLLQPGSMRRLRSPQSLLCSDSPGAKDPGRPCRRDRQRF